MKAVLCSCLCAFTVLGWLVSVRLAWPEPDLIFIQPKGAFIRAGSEVPVQLRRAALDPDDRELQVGLFCDHTQVAGFIVQINEFTSHTMPAERPRFIDTNEVCEFQLAAVVIAVKDGRTVGRARAVKTVDAR